MTQRPSHLCRLAGGFTGGSSTAMRRFLTLATAALIAITVVTPTPAKELDQKSFRRIATFPVFRNTCNGQPDDCINTTTVAEIVAASANGNLLIYTDSATGNIGFVDITTPSQPQPAGLTAVGGAPTSVAVVGDYALAAINTSPDLANPSGHLAIIDIPSQTVVRTIDLGRSA